MYKRFIRWASDRLADDGIIAFVTNSGFLDARQDDGFRKILSEEFNELWAVDLKGNARTSGERRRREGGNIFEDKIRVGIAIHFLVRRKGIDGFKVFYDAVADYTKSDEKAAYVKGKSLGDFDFAEITPDAKSNWLNQSHSGFEQLLPLANRQTKSAKATDDEWAMFGLFSNGVKTQRDEWVVDFDRSRLAAKVQFFSTIYESDRRQLAGTQFDVSQLDPSIKWDRELQQYLRRGIPIDYNEDCIVESLYRPFSKKHLYFLRELNAMQYQMPQIFPGGQPDHNSVICFTLPGSRIPFGVLATSNVPDLHLFIDGI